MKVLFSADWHIKLGAKNVPVDWAKNRFRKLFDLIHFQESLADIHIIGGDWFDKLPTLEELELYYEYITLCNCDTYIIPGNHEALKKDTTFFSYLKSITSRLNSKVKIIDDYHTIISEHGNLIDFIPYNRLKDFEKHRGKFTSPILVTHVRGEIPPHVKPEVDLAIFDQWKVVLAGDLHSYVNSQRNIIYPGSPLTTSFHRAPTDTGVIIIDTDTLVHEFVRLDLPQLLRKTIQAGEPMLPTSPHHTIYEVEGDMTELAGVSDNELIDKKVTKRTTDTTLILSPEMSIEQEITEYLAFVLELPEETIEKALKTYHDNIKNAQI